MECLKNNGEKIKSRLVTIKYKNRITGTGEILCDFSDYLKIAPSSKIILDGILRLNQNRNGNNGRTSILRMDENSVLNVKGKFNFFYGADIILFPKAVLSLGKRSYINSNCKIRCHKKISIGDYCAISHDFTIMDSDAHSINGHTYKKPVHIGNHVLIGTRVTILKGVTIGDGAIIAAGAVVVHDIPEKCLAAGVPAKVIKKDVTWGD